MSGGHLTPDAIHAYLDGEGTVAQRAAADRHVGECPTCAEALRGASSVVAAVRALPVEAEPPRDLWPGIEARMTPWRSDASLESGEPVVASGGHERRGRGRWTTPGRRVSVTLAQLYAAGVALALASGGLAWFAAGGRAPAPDVASSLSVPDAPSASMVARTPAADYDVAVAALERSLEEGRHLLAPETVAVLEESLAAIDRAIREAEGALRADPESDLLHRLLESYRQRRVRVLRQAVANLGET